MKLLKLITLVSMSGAEDSPDINDARGAAITGEYLETRINRVEEKCSFFMSKALNCVPPEEKQNKYNFRVSKVLNDVKWHQEVGKCLENSGVNESYRRRREDIESNLEELESEFSEVYAKEKNQRAAEISVKVLNRLEAVCRKFVDAFFEIPDLDKCGKYGAWKRRADHLLDDMTAMKNICLKVRLDGGTGY